MKCSSSLSLSVWPNCETRYIWGSLCLIQSWLYGIAWHGNQYALLWPGLVRFCQWVFYSARCMVSTMPRVHIHTNIWLTIKSLSPLSQVRSGRHHHHQLHRKMKILTKSKTFQASKLLQSSISPPFNGHHPELDITQHLYSVLSPFKRTSLDINTKKSRCHRFVRSCLLSTPQQRSRKQKSP